MNWYYVSGGQQVGPVAGPDFDKLVLNGTVQGETLVWKDGMPEWRPYQTIATVTAAAASFAATPTGALDLRPMNIGDILDRTFRLYRSHFMAFFLLMLCVQTCVYLLSLTLRPTTVLQPVASGAAQPAQAQTVSNNPWIAVLVLPVMLLMVVINQIGIATLTAAVSATFLGQEVKIREAYRAIRNRIGRLIGATILIGLRAGLAALLGVPFFIIAGFLVVGRFAGHVAGSPGGMTAGGVVGVLLMILGFVVAIGGALYVVVSYLLISEVVVLENLKVGAALRRSRELMRVKSDRGFLHSNITKASVILIITLALTFVVSGIVSAPFVIIGAMKGTIREYHPFGPLQIFQGVLTTLVQAAVMPVGIIAMILFYYDIRIRKEGFDLEVIASALETRHQPA